MHAMSRFPLRILSNASAWPSRTSAGLTTGAGSRGVIRRSAVSWRTSAARALMPAFDISGALGGAVASSLQPDSTIREVQAASVPMAAWILMPHLPFGWLSGGTTGGVRLDKAPRLNLARRSATGQERLRQEGIGARLPWLILAFACWMPDYAARGQLYP